MTAPSPASVSAAALAAAPAVGIEVDHLSKNFGRLVVLVCCSIGLNTRGGPREIGASVTRAVVTSLIIILLMDYFVSDVLLTFSS